MRKKLERGTNFDIFLRRKRARKKLEAEAKESRICYGKRYELYRTSVDEGTEVWRYDIYRQLYRAVQKTLRKKSDGVSKLMIRLLWTGRVY